MEDQAEGRGSASSSARSKAAIVLRLHGVADRDSDLGHPVHKAGPCDRRGCGPPSSRRELQPVSPYGTTISPSAVVRAKWSNHQTDGSDFIRE
jgi:hypothetical protein